MEWMRFDSGFTLQEIGDKFDLSRERVRQILGNTGHLSSEYRIKQIKEAPPDISNQGLGDSLGVGSLYVGRLREGWHIIDGVSGAAAGNGWEKWASNILTERGYTVELQPLGSHFDILLNELIKIDVKSSSALMPPSLVGRSINPRYTFHTRKCLEREPIDIYFCIANETKDVFIIPYCDLPMPKMSMQFTWPTARPKIGKYQKYHNRYDLLDARLKE